MFGDEIPEELPLELSIIVQSSVASSADRLSSRENSSPDTVLITRESKSLTLSKLTQIFITDLII